MVLSIIERLSSFRGKNILPLYKLVHQKNVLYTSTELQDGTCIHVNICKNVTANMGNWWNEESVLFSVGNNIHCFSWCIAGELSHSNVILFPSSRYDLVSSSMFLHCV